MHAAGIPASALVPADAPVERLQAAEVMLLQSPAGRKAEALAKDRLDVAEASLENCGITEADDTGKQTSFRPSFRPSACRNALLKAQSEIQLEATHEVQSDIERRGQSMSVGHSDKLHHDIMTEAPAESAVESAPVVAVAVAAAADKEVQAEVQAKTESAVVA